MSNCENYGFSCPEQIPTKRFSSPNSPLSPIDLVELKACIEQINTLLLAVGSPRNPDNLRGLRIHFRRLRGVLARVNVECNSSQEHIIGRLKDAGRDYIELDTVGQREFILFQRICSFTHAAAETCEKFYIHEPELLDIDPCLRRDLVLNFGKVVSSNPELFNIFFGLPLHLRLLQEIDCKVEVRMEAKEKLIKGILTSSQEKFIEVKTNEKKNTNEKQTEKDGKREDKEDNKEIQRVNFDDICFIRVL